MYTNNEPMHQRPRPVLMIPVRRCGSHAFRLRLNKNPAFYAPYPLHIVDFMPLVDLYGDLEDDANYFQLIIDVIGLQTASMIKWDGVVFDPVILFEAIKDEPRSIHRIIWEMLFRAGRLHGARVVMDKSLDSVHYADELVELFDDMLFLNVVRDPRAQISSMNKAIIHEFDTLLNTEIWLKAHETAYFLAKRHPQRMLTIRFEDFLADEETTLRKICAFLGLGFSGEMLDVTQSHEAAAIAQLSQLWESNASKPIPANADKFKQNLSMDEIELIETLTGSFMDCYGYERMTEGNARMDMVDLETAYRRNAPAKADAWNKLRLTDSRDYQLRQFRNNYINMVRERLLIEHANENLMGVEARRKSMLPGREHAIQADNRPGK